MATPRYEIDEAGMRELGMSSGVQQHCMEAANRLKTYAEQTAPVRSGKFKASFRVRPETVTAGRANDRRAGAVLENDAPMAWTRRGRGGELFMKSLPAALERRGG